MVSLGGLERILSRNSPPKIKVGLINGIPITKVVFPKGFPKGAKGSSLGFYPYSVKVTGIDKISSESKITEFEYKIYAEIILHGPSLLEISGNLLTTEYPIRIVAYGIPHRSNIAVVIQEYKDSKSEKKCVVGFAKMFPEEITGKTIDFLDFGVIKIEPHSKVKLNALPIIKTGHQITINNGELVITIPKQKSYIIQNISFIGMSKYHLESTEKAIEFRIPTRVRGNSMLSYDRIIQTENAMRIIREIIVPYWPGIVQYSKSAK